MVKNIESERSEEKIFDKLGEKIGLMRRKDKINEEIRLD